MPKQVPLYDALADDYDRFVNWEGRLSHELPFLVEQLRTAGAQRILDAACGTGQHAIALARQGFRVTGADLSAAMVERARQNASSAGVELSFAVAGLGELANLGGSYDAVLCLGNSLPHLLTAEAVEGALEDFAQVLRPGGLALIQNRNFDQVMAERQRFMDPQSHREGDQEWIFFRFYDFHEETIGFNMARLRRTETGWSQDVESTQLCPILRDDLDAALSRTGFHDVTFYGGCDGSAFDPKHSGDLITVTRKRTTAP